MALYIPHSIFHFGAAFVCRAGNFWTLLRISPEDDQDPPKHVTYIISVAGNKINLSWGYSLCLYLLDLQLWNLSVPQSSLGHYRHRPWYLAWSILAWGWRGKMVRGETQRKKLKKYYLGFKNFVRTLHFLWSNSILGILIKHDIWGTEAVALR